MDAKNDGEDDGGGVGGEAADQAEKADYQQWVEAKAPDWPDKWLPDPT